MPEKDKSLTRREFLTTTAGLAAGAAVFAAFPNVASCAKAQRKPNVLFIFADQMRNAALGCMGSPDVKTPNLDKLAAQGLLFTHAYSGYPLCSPYRSMLLTGRYGTSTGVIGNSIELPDKEVTIAKVLKQHGYKCGYIGKWHLEKNHDPFVPKERRLGFTDYWASRNVGGPSMFDNFYCGDTPEQIPMPGYEPDFQTGLAIDFIKKHKSEPFCLFLSWRPPHPPREAPKEYLDMYPPEKLTQRPNVPKNLDDRKNAQVYNAMITNLDTNVGRIIKALDELGLSENTIVCFSSDHGDMLGSQGLQGKNVPYEEAINIPFIMRYPQRIKAGTKTDVLFNSVDVMPTLLSLCGIPVPNAVQGLDLSDVVLGKSSKKPQSILLQRIVGGNKKGQGGEWRGVRTERYTYARFRNKGYVLFDNEKDPYQLNNLIDKPEAKSIQEKMEAELKKWLERIGDEFAPSETYARRFKDQMGKRWLRGQAGSDE